MMNELTYEERLRHYAESYMVNKLESLEELYLAKNSDYGNAAGDSYFKYGPISYVVRLEDKFSRLRSLSESNFSPKIEESIEDTLSDIINYCIMFNADLLNLTYSESKETISSHINLQRWESNDYPFNPLNKDLTDAFLGSLASINTELDTVTLYSGDGKQYPNTIRKVIHQADRFPYNIIFINGTLIRICLRELGDLHASEKVYLEDKQLEELGLETE